VRFLLRRLGWSLFVVWAVVSIAFVVSNLLPGDPARMVAGVQARPADVERIRQQLGLGDPALVQYAHFWRRLVHLGPSVIDAKTDPAHANCAVVLPLGATAWHVDLGRSAQKRQPVVDLVATRLPRTLALALQYVFARGLGWLPLDGFGTTLGEHARCLVLPALTLGVYGAAYYTRLVRDEMVVLLQQDWVRTARAKGLSPTRVVLRHGLRNALLPIVTAVGLDFGALMGGAVVTETVFRWPGLGELSVKALLDRDGPVILACVVVTSMAIVAANVIVDALYARLDPRVRSV
jgi:peptide/nickel transport system permease protein